MLDCYCRSVRHVFLSPLPHFFLPSNVSLHTWQTSLFACFHPSLGLNDCVRCVSLIDLYSSSPLRRSISIFISSSRVLEASSSSPPWTSQRSSLTQQTWSQRRKKNKKIPSEIEVAPCYKLLILFTLFTLIILYYTVWTALEQKAIMSIHIIWLYTFIGFGAKKGGGVGETPRLLQLLD